MESSSVLTGILDNPETLKLIPSTLLKIIVWRLHKLDHPNIENWAASSPVNPEMLQQLWKKFPLHWYNFLTSSSDSKSAMSPQDSSKSPPTPNDELSSGGVRKSTEGNSNIHQENFIIVALSLYSLILGSSEWRT